MSNQAVQLLEDNLRLVWNEKDPLARFQSIEKMYTADAILYHVGDKVTGHEEINKSVSAVMKNLPPAFGFTLLKPVTINNNIGRAIWGVGPKGQPPVSTGMDIAWIENGKIKALYVFLDN